MIYVENPEKTNNPMVIGNPHMTRAQYQSLHDVIEYAEDDRKTSAEMERFVSGINCDAESAREEMIAAKEAFGKNDGICAYHAVQSFKPGEITPDIAHEIGLKLAREMWGERYQVLVATHLDHDHIHNHFIINSVSFMDGTRLWKEKNYWKIRAQSDLLCREYGLSVTQAKSKGKHYAEWMAEQQGKPSRRKELRADIDHIMRVATSMPDFYDALRAHGYQVNTENKYISVRPPGAERNIRLSSLGDAYTEEALRLRVLQNRFRPKRIFIEPQRVRRMRGRLPHKKAHGIRALYFKWLYYLGAFKRRKPFPSGSAFVDERRKLDMYIRQFDYIHAHKLNTIDDVESRELLLMRDIAECIGRRDKLREEIRCVSDELVALEKLESISQVNATLKGKRAEVKLCEQIKERQEKIAGQIRLAGEIKSQGGHRDGRASDYQLEHRGDKTAPERE